MDDPEAAFDNALLSKMRVDYWYKAARIIGQVQADTWDTGVKTPVDFFLAGRLQALADAGLIEVRGDLKRIRYSEVRLAPRPEKQPSFPRRRESSKSRVGGDMSFPL